jgi:hypothetical protein
MPVNARSLDQNLKVVVDAAHVTEQSPEIVARIEDIWQRESDKRGKALFNGQLFSILREEADSITGWLAEYKWFLGQRRDPALFSALRVRPLAVTGLLICQDGVVFGRRAIHVEQDAGLWELVPSGGVDGSMLEPDGLIDLRRQLIAELSEEIGIGAEAVSMPPQPFAIVTDADAHVSDIGIIVRTNLSTSTIMGAFTSLKNREYATLKVVPTAYLNRFIKSHSSHLAAVSSALIEIGRVHL